MEKYIKLNTSDDVKEFVAITSTKEYDIIIETNVAVVDAKSVMCILGLDLTKPIKVKADCQHEGELVHQLQPFLWQLIKK